MTKQDTSQIGFCKNSSHKLQDITHQVNKSTSKIRLQSAKLFNVDASKEVLVLDFYPHFKDLAFVWEDSSVVGVEIQKLDRNLLKPGNHPFLLYLKAHFVGHELKGMVFEAEKAVFQFQGDRSFEWDFSKKAWIFKVAGRKDYSQRLPFWAPLSSLLSGDEKSVPKKVEELKAKAELKFEKLKINVEKDLADAKKWLEKNNPAIEYFFQSPQMWGEVLSKIPREFHSWIEEVSKSIPFSGSRKIALETLKKLQSRYSRKVQKAQLRLEELSKAEPKIIEENKKIQKEKLSPEKAAGPKRIALSEEVEAIVGRKATENDELFRKAQSRDLWFHVRGQRGAHVWIRRGQKGFGAKAELAEILIRKAATLAAKHSKASGRVSVDYTERRFLKKLKGSDAGALQVLQSKTIFVSIDEDKN